MGKTLFRAIMLVGLGVVAGLVHARVRPVVVSLPVQQTASTAGDRAAPAEKSPPMTQAAAPEGPQPQPEAAAPAVQEQPVATAPAQSSPPPAEQTQPTAPAMPEGVQMVSVPEAKALFDKQASGEWQGFFIDARRYVEFTEGHIRGAMHVDKKYFDGAVPKKVRDYLPGSPVVIYCHGESCTDSEAVAKRLIALKLNIGPIYILKEGYPGWVQAGHPTDAGGEAGF